MNKRIVYINLHCNDFLVRHLGRIMANNKVKSFKHQFLLKYFLDNGYDVCNLIIGQGTTAALPVSYFTHCYCGKKMESCYVLKNNNLPIIKSLHSISDIKEDDIVIAYFHYPEQMEILKSINCYKAVFGNHFIRLSPYSNLIDRGAQAFVNEIILSNNEFVKKYIGTEGIDQLLVPYSYGNRFESTRPFSQRLNKAMAVGTLSTVANIRGYEKYKEFYGTEWVQPMRKEILEHKDEIKEEIDCYISYIFENGLIQKKKNESIIEKVKRKYHNRKVASQSSYTSFDMVELFNTYKMSICPEELVGMPGIGFLEGMSSGCAYIGLDHEMYKCLGLVPNYHYITYDGTLIGLQNTVKEYMNKPEELERIALQGSLFVRSNFNEIAIASSFEKQLVDSYNKYITNKK